MSDIRYFAVGATQKYPEEMFVLAKEYERLNKQLEKAQVKVAELEQLAVRHMAGMISMLSSKGVDVSRQNAAYMSAVTGINTRSWLLREQAEAVEAARDEICEFRGELCNAAQPDELTDYAQRLRQQADEAEKSGGKS